MKNVFRWFILVLASLTIGCYSPRKAFMAQKNKMPNPQIQLNDVKITPARKDNFRITPNKVIDILHMDLAVEFNWAKHECMGKQTIQLKPYFYETDSITLDAKQMTFSKVELKDQQGSEILHLINYDKKILNLRLERKLKPSDTLSLTLHYLAKPDEKEKGGSKAIRDDKGLYFINTDNAEPNKPIQIWTQGETEANSCWFPTIDKPNEKFTSTLHITVQKDFTTLSNGIFEGSTFSENLRTDTWRNPTPMPAYLTMMAIGDFKTTQDTWREKEVSYYLEPNYHQYARNIFKHTVDMLEFFSNRLGVEYPWNKYAQVIVRDYVSGAMENTSATLHGESVQKNDRELLDNSNDGIIAHELFHQWFGDLVTCESWSHLVLNEGFATYGEQLWIEHHKGKDAALKKSWYTMERYLNYASKNNDGPIVDFNYKDKEDMFNTLTYQKGSRVLHLLRTTLGDDAFFQSIKNYLEHYRYKNAEIDDLRKEFEEVTGLDLKPFFQQWFLQGGHPVLETRYDYIDSLGLLSVTVEQKQSSEIGLFKFPLKFRVTQGYLSKDYDFNIEKRKEQFFVKKLDEENSSRVNITVDPEATFIGEIKDNKPFFNHIVTYNSAKGFVEKVRSLKELKEVQGQSDSARFTLLSAINDADEDIREKALDWIDWKNPDNISKTKDFLIHMAQNDASNVVRAKTIQVLGDTKNTEYVNLFSQLTHDSSYTVAGASLLALHSILPDEALRLCPQLSKDAKGKLFQAIATTYANSGTIADTSFFTQNMFFVFGGQRVSLLRSYSALMMRLGDESSLTICTNYLADRANTDSYPQVKLVAIQSLYQIQQKYEEVEKQTKDAELKLKFKESAQHVKQIIDNITNQWTDSNMISQLKMMGIPVTEN